MSGNFHGRLFAALKFQGKSLSLGGQTMAKILMEHNLITRGIPLVD